MKNNSKKPWLKNYPKGVSSNIKFDEYSSLVDMFKITCKRFSSNKALSIKEVIEHCKKYLTGYKIPKFVEFIDEIPKSNVGKILRRKLRDRKK